MRTDRPSDAWADMDLLLLVTDPDAIRDRDDWLREIGAVWVALRHPGPLRDLPVRQVMFEGALDFDIVAAPAGRFAEVVANPDARQALGEGFRPVLDKDGELNWIGQETAEALSLEYPATCTIRWLRGCATPLPAFERKRDAAIPGQSLQIVRALPGRKTAIEKTVPWATLKARPMSS